MSKHKTVLSSEEYERNIAAEGEQRFVLRLYVSGSTPRSAQAISNIKSLCEEMLQGRYDLEVIDLYQNPGKAREAEVIAVPTLIKSLPEPLKRILGDLSDKQRVLIGLNIHPKHS